MTIYVDCIQDRFSFRKNVSSDTNCVKNPHYSRGITLKRVTRGGATSKARCQGNTASNLEETSQVGHTVFNLTSPGIDTQPYTSCANNDVFSNCANRQHIITAYLYFYSGPLNKKSIGNAQVEEILKQT